MARVNRRSGEHTPRPRLKKYLLTMLLFGIVAFSGTGGTLASFSAETTNTNTTVASGTLTLSNTVGTGTACLSTGGSGNANSNCNAFFNLTNVEPGSWSVTGTNAPAQTASIAVKNTGSLNASHFYLWAPATNNCVDSQTTSSPVAGGTFGTQLNFNEQIFSTTLASTMTAGATTFTMSAAETIAANESLLLVNGSGQTWQFTAASASTGTSVTVTGASTDTFAAGSTVVPNSSCANLDNWIQESTTISGSTYYYCWFGLGSYNLTWNGSSATQVSLAQSGSAETAEALTVAQAQGSQTVTTNGLCVFPMQTTLNSAISSGTVNSISLTSLSGPIFNGDTLAVTNAAGSTLGTFTAQTGVNCASPTYPLPNATIGFNTGPQTVCVSGTASSTIPAGSTVTDTTVTQTYMTNDLNTVASFDTGFSISTGKLPLEPITGTGTVNNSSPVQLGFTGNSTYPSTRNFTTGVYLPSPNGTNENLLQGLQSTFGVTWHADQ